MFVVVSYPGFKLKQTVKTWEHKREEKKTSTSSLSGDLICLQFSLIINYLKHPRVSVNNVFTPSNRAFQSVRLQR